MIETDATKGIRNINYHHIKKWEHKVKIEKEEFRDDSSESDAKNRQQRSYNQALEDLLEVLQSHNEINISIIK